jgi:hypothetical protein
MRRFRGRRKINEGSEILLHCLESQMVFGLPSGQMILKIGDWVHLDREVLHTLKGIVDSSLLLTILY